MARRKRKSDEAPGWVWMLFGLGIGLIIAFGVYMNGGPATSAPAATPVAAQPPDEPIIEQPQTPAEVEPSAADAQPAVGIERLLAIMAPLRQPATGCPSDQTQTNETIANSNIEDAYEVSEDNESGDLAELKVELRALILQVV